MVRVRIGRYLISTSMDFSLTCPYCGEPGELEIDATDEPSEQEFVQDCEVCCRPWSVTIRTAADGSVDVQVERDD
jgi:hypothetical protein